MKLERERSRPVVAHGGAVTALFEESRQPIGPKIDCSERPEDEGVCINELAIGPYQ
jgi:hypothetical protein